MDVVCHAAESMDAAIELYGHLLHEQVKTVTISIVEKYRLAGIAAKDDVIDCTGEMDSWFACHGVEYI